MEVLKTVGMRKVALHLVIVEHCAIVLGNPNNLLFIYTLATIAFTVYT